MVSLNHQADYLQFAVLDSGPGVAPDVRAGLFHPFRQADSSTTRKHGGTGLGLAICKVLVALMSGRIESENRPECGSRFWFDALFLRVEAAVRDAQFSALHSATGAP